MPKTNLKSDWDSSGNLVFTANASGSGAMVFNTATPVVLGTLAYPLKSITVKTSAANYQASAAELLSGVISDTCNAAITCFLPSVNNVCNAIAGWQAGTTFDLFYRNPGNSTITLQADNGSQWSTLGTLTIAAANTKTFEFIIATNATGTVVAKGSCTGA